MRFLLSFFIALFMIFSSIQAQDYTIPDPPAGADLDEIVLQVEDTEVTLADLRARIRYERFYRFYFLESVVAESGEQILDVNDTANQFSFTILQLMDGIAADDEFAQSVYDSLIIETVYRVEAENRELEIDECSINQTWLQILNPIQQVTGCELPEGFDDTRSAFIERIETYTGFTGEMLETLVTTYASVDAVNNAISEEVEVEDVETARSRHIRVETMETANEVYERLQAGEDFEELLLEYTLDEGADGDFGELPPFAAGASGKGPEFEQAAFDAEIGDIIGPIETADGYYVIEVLEQATTPSARARHILVETEEDANSAIGLIEGGSEFADIAANYSLDTGSGSRGGDLGEFQPGMMVPPFEEAVFSEDNEVGEIIGPVETQFGFHVIEVLERTETVTGATVRRILVETEEEAQGVLERLEADEDFNELAAEVSIDPATIGHQGDTRVLTAFSPEPGFYEGTQTFPGIRDAVFGTDEIGLLEPVEGRGGFYVIEVLERGTRPPTEAEIQNARNNFVVEWQEEQFDSERVEETDFWTEFIPQDPNPSDVAEVLAPVDELLAEAVTRLEEERAATTIPNILRNLELPPDLTSDEDDE